MGWMDDSDHGLGREFLLNGVTSTNKDSSDYWVDSFETVSASTLRSAVSDGLCNVSISSITMSAC